LNDSSEKNASQPDNPAHVIAEAVSEAQAILHDHLECGRHSPQEALARLNLILSEKSLLQAMYDVGYFPSSTPPNRPFSLR
jgi:tRNA isopentenyl-2-thiomethyl-A-37 hydroxylase MiaE